MSIYDLLNNISANNLIADITLSKSVVISYKNLNFVSAVFMTKAHIYYQHLYLKIL